VPSADETSIEGPRILVSGWAGAGNVGDELLTRSLVAQIRANDAVPVVASRAPESTAALHGVESVAWGPKGRATLRSVDGVCLGPGGILQDSSSLWSLPGHLSVPGAARRRGIPLAAIGVGAEPLRRRSSGWLLRRVLAGRPVVTRDSDSSAALAAAGLDPTTGADVVFGLELPAVERRREIVVSVGGTVGSGVITPARRRIRPAPIGLIAEAVDRLASRLDATVVLTRFRGARDAAAAAELADRLRSPSEVLSDDVDEHVRRVCGARVVVSSRYHPIVLAARAGVPALAVSTQAKVRSLAVQIGSPGVQIFDSWDDVGRAETPEAVPPAVLEGVAVAHEAVGALVRAARATRAERSSG